MLLITLRLVYTESVDGYVNIVADAKCQVVEKRFQMFATGTVTIDCTMHHCFDVASASRHTPLLVHTGTTYIHIMRTNINVNSVTGDSLFLVGSKTIKECILIRNF